MNSLEANEMRSNDAQTETINNPAPANNDLFATFVLTGMSAIVSESITYPLDSIKTRMQVSYATEAVSDQLTGFTFRSLLFRPDGTPFLSQVHELLLGFDAACLRHVFYSGLRVVTYEQLRDLLLSQQDTDILPLWQSSVCALAAGAFGQFVASPTDFVKVHLQVEGLRLSLKQRRLYDSSWHCTRSLLDKYGVAGMWNGCLPNVQRGAVIQIGGLTGYDSTKQWVIRHGLCEDNYVAHGVASFVAGLLCTIICNPFDVVKTRIMKDPKLFSGPMHCALTIVRNEGFFSLYTGFLPIWARLGPWNMTFFITFEQLRRWYGIKSY